MFMYARKPVENKAHVHREPPRAERHAYTGAVPPVVREVLRSSGVPLEIRTRALLEPRFGVDLSTVRVHADARAAEAASSIGALAFTAKDHLVFATGEYAPQTAAGIRLLSHELTHVRDQRASADARSGVLLQKQDDPRKELSQTSYGLGLSIKPLSLDDNPARGATERARRDAESVLTGKASPSDVIGSVLDRIFAVLDRWDKSLMGDAKQSWGMSFWGEGSNSKESTAAKPTKDVTYLNSSSFNVMELLSMFDLVLLALSKPHEIFKTPAELKEKPIDAIYDLKQKIEDIKKEMEREKRERERDAKKAGALLYRPSDLPLMVQKLERDVKAARPALVQYAKLQAQSGAASKVATSQTLHAATVKKSVVALEKNAPKKEKLELGQWVAYDAFNSYAKHLYDDGSTRFTMGSVFGVKEITNPGQLDWKRVSWGPGRKLRAAKRIRD
jgi:hypothetical protein